MNRRWLILFFWYFFDGPTAKAIDRAFEGSEQQAHQARIDAFNNNIQKVDKTIAATQELLRTRSGELIIPDLLLRLAELFVEKSRLVFHRFQEIQSIQEHTVSGEKALEVQVLKKRAIDLYTQLLKEYPNFAQNDQVRFYRAHEYRDLGEWNAMVDNYKELIEKYPKSSRAVEARIVLGDFYYDKGNLAEANRYYLAALDIKNSPLFALAAYKLGWIRINEDKMVAAMNLFEQAVTHVVDATLKNVLETKMIDARMEALLALTWPYTETKKPEEAPAYFRKLAPTRALYIAALERLAERYGIKGKHVDAGVIYRELFKCSLNHQKMVDYAQHLDEAIRSPFQKTNDPTRTTPEDVFYLLLAYRSHAYSTDYNQGDKNKFSKDIELRTRDLATKLHVAAQSSQDKTTAEMAARTYNSYLLNFTDSSQKWTMLLNQAEALFQAQDFVGSGQAYENMATQNESLDPENKRKHLYSAILAYYKAIEHDSSLREQHQKENLLLDKYQRLTAREGLKALGTLYIKSWPIDKNISGIKFNIARMHYEELDYEKASELFSQFVAEYPSHRDTANAVHLALDALHRIDRYDQMTALAQKFVTNRAITDTQLKQQIADIGKRATDRQLETVIASQNNEDFGERILAEWEKNKTSQLGEEYLYAAFIKYKNDNNVASLLDFGGRILGTYPSSKRIPEVLATMANFSAQTLDFERAAFLYEHFQKKYNKEKNALDFLHKATQLRILLGDRKATIKNLLLLEEQPDTSKRLWAYEEHFKLLLKEHDWSTLAELAEKVNKLYPRWSAPVALQMIALMKETKDFSPFLNRLNTLSANSLFDKTIQAQAYFGLAYTLYQELITINFQSVEQAENILSHKLSLLGQIETLYINAIKLGVAEWLVASLYGTALAYDHFATFIQKAPIPEGISQPDRDTYTQALVKEAAQYVQKRQDTMLACQKKSIQLLVLTPLAAECSHVSSSLREISESDIYPNTPMEHDKVELDNLREQLAKNPFDLTLLETAARRAIAARDYYLAHLILSKALETNSKHLGLNNLSGLVYWSLGDFEEALAAFEMAHKGNFASATANMATLLLTFHYKDKAQPLVKKLPADLSSLRDLHQTASKLLGKSSD